MESDRKDFEFRAFAHSAPSATKLKIKRVAEASVCRRSRSNIFAKSTL
jgi:hypothetical protein